MKVSNLPYGLIARAARERGLPPLIEWVEFCAERGLDGVEIAEAWLASLQWLEVTRLIESIHKLGIEVSALNAFNAQPNQPPGEARDEAVREMERYLEMAEAFGTPLVIIGSGNWGDYDRYRMSRAQAIDNTVATIEACLPAAQKRGVALLVENHPGWLTLRADALVEMLDRLPDEVGLNLDTGSMYREGQRPRDFLEHDIVARRTRYVHLKTIRFEPDPEVGWWNQGLPFEESDVDYATIFGKLKAAAFDGWLSYEASADVGLAGLPPGAEFARKTWQAR